MDSGGRLSEAPRRQDVSPYRQDPPETIKEQREVSYFDPDVDRILVVVEVKTLLLDNLALAQPAGAIYLCLYTTFRDFPRRPRRRRSTCNCEYRDANVIRLRQQDRSGRLEPVADRHRQRRHDSPADSRATSGSRCIPLPRTRPTPGYFGFAEDPVSTISNAPVGRCSVLRPRRTATEGAGILPQDLESRQLAGDISAARSRRRSTTR